MTSVVEAFRRQVAQRPDAVAVTALGGGDPVGADASELTYARLDAWSDAVAARLAASGTRPGDRVAVRLPRSAALVTALLGVLKAGAAYVPVDEAAPARRVADVIADAEPASILCHRPGEDGFAAPGVAEVAVPPVPALSPPTAAAGTGAPALPEPAPTDLAYLMYTSGSTGRPKAVMVEHRSIVNLVDRPNFVALGPGDRVLHLAPAAFDAATFEVWGALLNGARLVLAPPGPVSPEELGALVRGSAITVLWLTAALFHRQIDVDPLTLAPVRTVLAGGDVLSAQHVRRLLAAVPSLTVVNGYGPTETTTFACCHRVDPACLGTSVPIGRPVQNVDLRVVDDAGRPVPPGAAGAVDRRPRCRARVLAAPRGDRVRLRHGVLRRRSRAALLPFRRPGAASPRRAARVPRPPGRPVQAARLPHRTRRDRERPGGASGRADRRSRPTAVRARRPPPGGLGGPGRRRNRPAKTCGRT